ncbi:piggyBac transposable element-derived protein 4-like [Acipenser oxyrinchus oxyrinchus]|uniref:PiggyBac transposable element-derived protein 4-like n=1 Tax=Acipenser oxyrinchus oxyrinchus TaxID=40147 RepID=A0AAD8CM46_ACIOX|nr:piggyBac transposable element-derived protein 4-like [Acipenser oxyrinchus oxyrinchus]
MEAAHISPELPIRWVVSADRTVEIKEEVTELGCDQANERILQEETPPSSITERVHIKEESPALESVHIKEESPALESVHIKEESSSVPCVSDPLHASNAFLTYDDPDHEAPTPLAFTPKRPVGTDFGNTSQVLRSSASRMTREIDFFTLFFTQEVVADICGFTNARGWGLVTDRPSHGNRQGAWDEVTPGEFLKFIGLIIYMGIVRLPDLHRYWSPASCRHGLWARAFMTRDRFESVMAALHIVDPDAENNEDRLRKLRYLTDHLKRTCKKLYQPNLNLAVDERMVKSKGRSGFGQHMKDKPTRWGFKLWVLATSDTGYAVDFYVYTGGRDGRVTDLAKKVVLELVDPLAGQGYNLWLGNFYTSPALLVELNRLGFNVCGTYNIKRHFPAVMKDFQTWERRSKRGDMRWRRLEEGNILALQWRDTRTITCLSSFHSAHHSTEVSRLSRKGRVWSREVVRQPAAIRDCKQFMGGVDKLDQRIGTYHVLMKSMKWWQTLFFHFLDMAILNSFLLFQDWKRRRPEAGNSSPLENYTHLHFRENLCRQLGGINIDDDRVSFYKPPAPTSTPVSSFHSLHVPELTSSKRNCWLCYRRFRKEQKTLIVCMAPDCNTKPLCFVRNRNCFQIWHSPNGDCFR